MSQEVLPRQLCLCILRILDQHQSSFYDVNKQETFLKVYVTFNVPAFCSWGTGYGEGNTAIQILAK